MPDREEFAKLVEALNKQVDGDLDDPERVTKRYMKKRRDADRAVSEVSFLTLRKGPVRLGLDPTAYDIPGAEAAVDLYLMPTYDPLATSYSEDGRRCIHPDFLPRPETEGPMKEGRRAPLSRDTLNQVMETIAEHAVPSL
jgi:hypothetical protein